MQTVNQIPSRTTLALGAMADTIPGRAVFALAASAFIGLCAHVSLPLFFTPVPLTLSNMAVLLVGLTLGPSTAFAALILYLAEGAMGLPVFTPGGGPAGIAHLMGPNAGYLFAYPLAAVIAGATVRALRPAASHFKAAVLANSLATVVIFILGAGWLAMLLHLSPVNALRLGVVPFLAGEALKIAAAAGIYSGLKQGVGDRV